MRLFIAGPLPSPLQASVFEFLAPVRRAAPQVRWVRAGQLHLTLAFLGEVPAPAVQSLVEALRPVGARHRGLLLAVQGVGCFGRPPHVLFAEVTGELDGLRALAEDLRTALGPEVGANGSPRPFRPHLTLARGRGRRGDPALDRCRRALGAPLLGEFLLDHLVLFQSELERTGPVHSPLVEFPLGGRIAAHP